MWTLNVFPLYFTRTPRGRKQNILTFATLFLKILSYRNTFCVLCLRHSKEKKEKSTKRIRHPSIKSSKAAALTISFLGSWLLPVKRFKIILHYVIHVNQLMVTCARGKLTTCAGWTCVFTKFCRFTCKGFFALTCRTY